MLERAIEVARQALEGKKDQNGRPYFEHASRIMDQMSTEEEKTVAILHDVLEDTEMTMADLMEYDFSRSVLEAVDQLTKRSDMTYDEYIDDISSNPIAVKIKIAEIKDNKDIFRVNKMSFKTYSMEERARRALKILQNSQI